MTLDSKPENSPLANTVSSDKYLQGGFKKGECNIISCKNGKIRKPWPKLTKEEEKAMDDAWNAYIKTTRLEIDPLAEYHEDSMDWK